MTLYNNVIKVFPYEKKCSEWRFSTSVKNFKSLIFRHLIEVIQLIRSGNRINKFNSEKILSPNSTINLSLIGRNILTLEWFILDNCSHRMLSVEQKAKCIKQSPLVFLILNKTRKKMRKLLIQMHLGRVWPEWFLIDVILEIDSNLLFYEFPATKIFCTFNFAFPLHKKFIHRKNIHLFNNLHIVPTMCPDPESSFVLWTWVIALISHRRSEDTHKIT